MPETQPPVITRRTVATGLAWAVPTTAAAVAAPAFAASCSGQCFTMNWNQWDNGTMANGLVGTTTPTSSEGCASGTNPTVSIHVTQTGEPGTPKYATASTNMYNTNHHGMVGYRGQSLDLGIVNTYTLNGMSSSNRGLVLNIGYCTSSTVTFTVSQPVTSFTLPMYDLTRTNSAIRNQQHQDTVEFSMPVTLTGDTGRLNATSGTGPFFRTRETWTGSSKKFIDAEVTSEKPFTSFSVTYTAPAEHGWQFMGFGAPSFCTA